VVGGVRGCVVANPDVDTRSIMVTPAEGARQSIDPQGRFDRHHSLAQAGRTMPSRQAADIHANR
jgi:hypothetical protein